MNSRKLIPVTLPLTVALLAHCGQDETTSGAAKESIVATPVLPGESAPPSVNANAGRGDAGSSTPSSPSTPPSTPSTPDTTPKGPVTLEQPIDTICSNMISDQLGGNVMSASSIGAVFADSADRVVCEIHDRSIRDTLINEHKLRLTDVMASCPTLADGTYTMKLIASFGAELAVAEHTDSTGQQTAQMFLPFVSGLDIAAAYVNLLRLSGASAQPAPQGSSWPQGLPQGASESQGKQGPPELYKIAVAIGSGKVTFSAPVKGAILMDRNPLGSNGLGSNAECTSMGSPLLAQIRPGRAQPAPIHLTPPLSGIRFDLLGKNSYPSPHHKKQISWFAPDAAQGDYFIVLPGADGTVRGIDEMFGNNTLGPDGRFAENGYEALKKWDGRRDDGTYDERLRGGAITPADPVFGRLRLWSDVDGDGAADTAELFTLGDLGVVAIDLAYDASFKETDRYGNQVKMRSVVRTSDGLNHLMYDIWFRIID